MTARRAEVSLSSPRPKVRSRPAPRPSKEGALIRRSEYRRKHRICFKRGHAACRMVGRSHLPRLDAVREAVAFPLTLEDARAYACSSPRPSSCPCVIRGPTTAVWENLSCLSRDVRDTSETTRAHMGAKPYRVLAGSIQKPRGSHRETRKAATIQAVQERARIKGLETRRICERVEL